MNIKSNILNNVDDNKENIIELIGGIVGIGTAVEFRTWLSIYKDLPNIEDIFKGKCDHIPNTVDCLYALTTSIVAYAREHKKEIEKIMNSINYLKKLPTEYSVLALKDYLYIDKELKSKLLKRKEFISWLSEKGTIVDAVI